MKIAIAAAVLSLGFAFSAGAAEYHAASGKQPSAAREAPGCERGTAQRIAFTPSQPCCAGQMVCSQFLSTNTMVKPKVDSRT